MEKILSTLSLLNKVHFFYKSVLIFTQAGCVSFNKILG